MKLSVLGLATIAFAASAAAGSTEGGLVARYSCDEGSGTVLGDGSGNGNDGEILGGGGWGGGPWGTALRLDGVDDYVDCGRGFSAPLETRGSVVLWFKPIERCQGGLVAWTAGAKPADQRLVTALNTYKRNRSRGVLVYKELGVYMADGAGSYEVHQSNFHDAYFPAPGQWLHFAVTWDGRSVNVYRDGVRVYSRFQTIAPVLKDLALWLGRCHGYGGPSDFFKGLLDEVCVYQRALSDRDVYRLYRQTVEGRGKDATGLRSLRIKPTVLPRAGTVFADLDYRGLASTSADVSIKADLLNAAGKVIAGGTVRMLPVWGRAEAVFDTAALPAGECAIRATSKGEKSVTMPVHWPGRARGWENVKVLNNLCWELVNETPGKAGGGSYTFRNPRRGWVLFQSAAAGKLKLSVGTANPPVIHGADGEPAQEAMRWLSEGEYTIRVSGAGTLERLVVRSVPTLTFGHYPHVGPGTGNDHEFLAKHVLGHVNTLATGNYGEEYNPGDFRSRWSDELGRTSFEMRYPRSVLQKQLDDKTIEQQIHDFLAKAAGMNKRGFGGILLDEFDPGDDYAAWYKSYYDEWIEVCTSVQTAPEFAGRFVVPYFSYNMFDFEKSSAFLRNIVRHGSYLDWEVYLNEHVTEAAARLHIDEGLAGLMGDWERAVPGFTERAFIALSYLRREDWCPEVDFRVFLDMQFEHLATRPEFFGLAGVELYASHHAPTEEYVRWAARLQRHYGLEGNRARLSEDPYSLALITNGDFADGTAGWTVVAAEKDSVGTKSHKGLGVLQERYPYRAETETTLLWTRRSREKPNVVSQEIRDIEAGRLYSVRLTTADYGQLVEGKATEQQHAVSIRVDGAEPMTDWYRTKSCKGSAEIYSTWRTVGPFSAKNRYWLNNHKHVFRATGPTATLVISDWRSADEPGGPIGQQLAFNFIQVQPYFEIERGRR